MGEGGGDAHTRLRAHPGPGGGNVSAGPGRPCGCDREEEEEEEARPAAFSSVFSPPPSAGSSRFAPAVTQHAPFFKGTAVVNGEFKELSLDDFKGKYLVLFFYPLDL